MIVLTPNKAGNLATSESDISETDSCTDSDFSSCLGGAAPDILAGAADGALTVSHWLRSSARRGKLASTLSLHTRLQTANWSKSRLESTDTVHSSDWLTFISSHSGWSAKNLRAETGSISYADLHHYRYALSRQRCVGYKLNNNNLYCASHSV